MLPVVVTTSCDDCESVYNDLVVVLGIVATIGHGMTGLSYIVRYNGLCFARVAIVT